MKTTERLQLPAADELRAVLNYDPLTGLFTYRVRWFKCHAGERAGSLKQNGYVRIGFNGRQYFAHRLAWLYVHGECPFMVDHRNGVRHDNRIDNLRPATHAINSQNRTTQKNNRLGIAGVRAARGKFRASIFAGGRERYLGAFETAEQARLAYVDAKRVLHEGNTL